MLVLVSGLTALDVLVALKGCGHRGTVHVLSRRGRYPEVHETVAPYDVIPALDTRGARALLRSFRSHVDEAARRGFDWRAVVDSLLREVEAIWRRLEYVERRRFERHLRTHWERRRHRAPKQVDAVREEYQRAGRLRNYAGRLSSMTRGTATIALRDAANVELRPDWIVNASGVGRVSAMKRDPLLTSMLTKGIISSDTGGIGLRVRHDLSVIDAIGNAVPGLWIVGPAVRGSRFEATAVPELRVMAELAAAAILRTRRSRASAIPAVENPDSPQSLGALK